MEGESNEWQRRIEELRKQIAVLKAVVESGKREQEAERKVLKSDLAETLTRFEAKAAEERATDRAAAARESAERKQENERLRTEMHRAVLLIIGAIGGLIVFFEYVAK